MIEHNNRHNTHCISVQSSNNSHSFVDIENESKYNYKEKEIDNLYIEDAQHKYDQNILTFINKRKPGRYPNSLGSRSCSKLISFLQFQQETPIKRKTNLKIEMNKQIEIIDGQIAENKDEQSNMNIDKELLIEDDGILFSREFEFDYKAKGQLKIFGCYGGIQDKKFYYNEKEIESVIEQIGKDISKISGKEDDAVKSELGYEDGEDKGKHEKEKEFSELVRSNEGEGDDGDNNSKKEDIKNDVNGDEGGNKKEEMNEDIINSEIKQVESICLLDDRIKWMDKDEEMCKEQIINEEKKDDDDNNKLNDDGIKENNDILHNVNDNNIKDNNEINEHESKDKNDVNNNNIKDNSEIKNSEIKENNEVNEQFNKNDIKDNNETHKEVNDNKDNNTIENKQNEEHNQNNENINKDESINNENQEKETNELKETMNNNNNKENQNTHPNNNEENKPINEQPKLNEIQNITNNNPSTNQIPIIQTKSHQSQSINHPPSQNDLLLLDDLLKWTYPKEEEQQQQQNLSHPDSVNKQSQNKSISNNSITSSSKSISRKQSIDFKNKNPKLSTKQTPTSKPRNQPTHQLNDSFHSSQTNKNSTPINNEKERPIQNPKLKLTRIGSNDSYKIPSQTPTMNSYMSRHLDITKYNQFSKTKNYFFVDYTHNTKPKPRSGLIQSNKFFRSKRTLSGGKVMMSGITEKQFQRKMDYYKTLMKDKSNPYSMYCTEKFYNTNKDKYNKNYVILHDIGSYAPTVLKKRLVLSGNIDNANQRRNSLSPNNAVNDVRKIRKLSNASNVSGCVGVSGMKYNIINDKCNGDVSRSESGYNKKRPSQNGENTKYPSIYKYFH